jgi:hypothetical protein
MALEIFMTKKYILWSGVQLLIALLIFFAFASAVPYLGSDPIEAVSSAIAAQMPAGCPAVYSNHGHYSCFWQGPLRSHPWQFVFRAGALLLLWAFLIFTLATKRGLPLNRNRESKSHEI